MSTILRLEGLDVKAGTEDIRTFFQSLHIPDGGVYIMGGHLGEAFISFTTVSDAQAVKPKSGPHGINILRPKSRLHEDNMTRLKPKSRPHDVNMTTNATSSEVVRNPEHTLDLRPGYVRLFGLPASITKGDICKFFKGLRVEDVIVDVELGISRGCLVKFADMQDASDALGFNQQMLGSIPVEVRGAEEKLWVRALQECSKVFDDRSKCKHERSPTEKAHYERRSVVSHKRTSDQVPFKPLKHPKRDAEPNASLSRSSDYTVMVRNLPKNMTKTDIKELFRCQNLPHKNVLHLNQRTGPTDPRLQRSFRKNMPATVKKSQIRSLFCKFSLSLDDIMLLHDREGYGSGEAVVKFESEQQVTQAQRLHGEEFLGSNVLLTPINEKQMKNILNRYPTVTRHVF
uniref:RNA binding motif protein 12Ba n=1 Tax=Xiphophorus maculatus TaxID=8083 RepID=M4AFF5_XIPMA